MSLTVDGTGSAASTGTGTSLGAAITTTLTDNIIVCVVCWIGAGFITGMAGGSIQWARQRHKSFTNALSQVAHTEVWWAYAPAALSAQTITATFNTTIGSTISMHLFAVNGADLEFPFDPNTALPAYDSHAGSGGSTNHTVSSISTTNANTLEFCILFTSENSGSGTKGPDSGFTDIKGGLYPSAGSTASYSEYKVNSATISGGSQNIFTDVAISTNYSAYVDAIQGAVAGSWVGPTLVNSAAPKAFAAGSTSTTLNMPASVVTGNLLLAEIAITVATGTITWPAGWTEIDQFVVNLSSPTRTQLGGRAYRIATGSGDTMGSISWTSGGQGLGRIDQFTTVNQVTPIGAISHDVGNSATITTTTVTTTKPNSLVLNYLDHGTASNIDAPLPSPWTAGDTGTISTPGVGTYSLSYEKEAVSGTTSDSANTTGGTSAQYVNFMTEILTPAKTSTQAQIIG